MSPMFGERALKTPLFGADHASPDVLEMEAAVCRLDFEQRDLIIARWQRHMSYRQIAKRIGQPFWSVGPKLRAAESEVHRLLEQGPSAPQQSMLHIRSAR
jgi:DNA-directed RNA polymerase specialized sigma24 family protein